jgi:glycosyltransferase involved in cell wall biosynthesis
MPPSPQRNNVRIVLSNASVKWGGVHVVTEILARGLLARGHEVSVFGAPGSALEERMNGIAAFEPILQGMDLHPVAMLRAGSALRRHRTQVVLAMMKKDVRLTVPAASLQGIPSIVRHANDRPLRGWLYDRALFGGLPALHIANSEATRATLLKSAPWLDENEVRVIHNGVDPASIEEATPAELGLPGDAVVVGFAARLERRKGLLDLMNAWPVVAKSASNAHLVIAGKGADEARARTLIGDAPRVHWLGYRSDVPAVLRALDIAVVPSHWEGFGLIAAEAMLAGVPVVAARASSLPEIVTDGEHGRLVPPYNPEALAAAILELVRDREARTRMGTAGRARALRDFGAEAMIDAYEDALESVVRRKA